MGIYPDKTIILKDIWTAMFVVALYTIAMTWKQPSYLSTDKWIKNMWYYKYNGILLSHKEGQN